MNMIYYIRLKKLKWLIFNPCRVTCYKPNAKTSMKISIVLYTLILTSFEVFLPTAKLSLLPVFNYYYFLILRYGQPSKQLLSLKTKVFFWPKISYKQG